MKRSDKIIVLLTIVLVGCCLAYCVVFVVPWYDTEEKVLSPRTRLIEKRRIRRRPLPGCTDRLLVGQTLEFEGRTVWSARIRGSGEFGEGFHVSPNERFVVIEHWLHAKPIVILKLDTSSVDKAKIVTVNAPRIDGHYYAYPFGFVKWDDDSKSFTVEVTGTYVKDSGQFLAYRELWQVQADSGKAQRLRRQEQPRQEKLKWED